MVPEVYSSVKTQGNLRQMGIALREEVILGLKIGDLFLQGSWKGFQGGRW